ncbi:hypothetical protein SUGI_0552710 [Cryptomeria japonica]|uniref:uncharacterized protein LOC131036501 n=1 Tax=Cryptomeria japonica TaxID=3369 RepID=UPI002408A0FB|nr:uncharacterized protein LOC131036501 [Cryptomeria japonica]GLJ28136.1 hypothetical protein SUGI_0552710 [Cryptomeria japonica]
MYQLTEINQRLEKGQLICPIPHRMAMGPWAVRDIHESNHSYATAGNEEEPSFEILGIFLSKKSQYGDQTTVNNSVPYFYGSPPIRSDNPLVHDAEFIRKGAPSSPVNMSQKTSCGALYVTKPSVRIEGFALKGQKAHCNLSALV